MDRRDADEPNELSSWKWWYASGDLLFEIQDAEEPAVVEEALFKLP